MDEHDSEVKSDGHASAAPLTPEPTPVGDTEAGGGIEVRLFARTDVGQLREHNEDNFLVADLSRRVRGLLDASRSTAIGPHGVLLAVCDGMGGAAAGEIASQRAVDVVFERMIAELRDDAPHDRDALARRLVGAIETAGYQIFQEARSDRSRRGMGTTITAAALLDRELFLAQVGDSRAYILRDGKLVQVTRDQSLVNQLIEAGQLTEEEAETFEHNNIILQALGTNDTVQVDLTHVPLVRGDILLLCSDGLSGMVRDPELREILRSGADTPELCRVLIERANQAGGHDNITAIVAQFDGAALPTSPGEEPALAYRKYALPEAASAPRDARSALTGPPSGGALNYDDQDEPDERPFNEEPLPPQPLPTNAYIPPWLVVLLVLGVIGVLVASARVMLR